MNTRWFLSAAIAAVCGATAAPANAGMFRFKLPDTFFVASPYIQGNFQFISDQTFDNPVDFINERYAGWEAGPNETLGGNYAHTGITIETVNGKPFTISNLGLAGIYNSGIGGIVDVSITKNGSVKNSELTLLPDIFTLQEFTLDAKGITSLYIRPDTLPYIQFAPGIRALEPETWTLMVLGVGLVGYSLRGHRRINGRAAVA